MNETPRRTTQSDVAKVARVSRATVSLALRKHPGIPEKTRLRIEKLAAQLGYVPDPMLAALATYRNRHRAEHFRGTLAWFAETTPEYAWTTVPNFISYHESATRAAQRLGYKLEVFDVAKMKVSWQRAATIAQARGIRGILICPLPHADTHIEAFPWEKFSAVSFGYSLTRPRLHSVTSAHFTGVQQIMQQLHDRGYKRVGFAFRAEHDQRINHSYIAGYLTAGHLLPSLTLLPPCHDDAHHDSPLRDRPRDGSELKAWLKEYKPDCLIIGTPNAFQLMKKEWGLRIPKDLGVASACIAQNLVNPFLARKKIVSAKDAVSSTDFSELCGMVEDDERIGEVAVDLLVAMMQRGERGVPEKPQRVLVDALWHEGNSLRPQVLRSSDSCSRPAR